MLGFATLNPAYIYSKKAGLYPKTVIQEGLAEDSGRISNPNTMKKNFKNKYKITEIPKDHQMSHLTPDQVWQDNPLTQEASRRGVATVDDDSNSIAQPENAEAFKDKSREVKALESQGALAKIIHNGSHPKWNRHVDEVIRDRTDSLKEQYGRLEDVPAAVLKAAIEQINQNLRRELIDVANKIKRGDKNKLPDWIDPNYEPKDGNGKKYPRLSEVPNLDSMPSA